MAWSTAQRGPPSGLPRRLLVTAACALWWAISSPTALSSGNGSDGIPSLQWRVDRSAPQGSFDLPAASPGSSGNSVGNSSGIGPFNATAALAVHELNALGVQALGDGDAELGRRVFAVAAEVDPGNPVVLFNLAVALKERHLLRDR